MSERSKWWCKEFGNHPRVKEWILRNPPPKRWKGTPEEWAYEEMLFAPDRSRTIEEIKG